MTSNGAATVWRCVVPDGPLRDDLTAAAGAIVEDLVRQWRSIRSPWLINGLAGVAVCLDYARECGVISDPDLPSELLRSATEGAEMHAPDLSLFFGHTGLATTESILGCDAVDTDGWALRLDDVLVSVLTEPPLLYSHDLFRGLSGMAVYALNRSHSDQRGVLIPLIVGHLESLLVNGETGVTWMTHERLATPPGLEPSYADFGMPHGTAGALGAMSRLVAAANGSTPHASRTLIEVVAATQAARLSDNPGELFPCAISDGKRHAPTRLGWCYGDLAVSTSLYAAGTALGNSSTTRSAVDIALSCAKVPPKGVGDSTLCHGPAGVAHLFSQWYSATGLVQFQTAAMQWFSCALADRVLDAPFGGFRSLRNGHWEFAPGFLRGAAGIAAAFLSACHPIYPRWSRLLLADLPLTPISPRVS